MAKSESERDRADCGFLAVKTRVRCLLLAIVGTGMCLHILGAADLALVQRPWYEARSLHFLTYSCGPAQEVAKLTARLEQFRLAYATLAGTQAVASPPIVVIAFDDRQTLEKFVPLYNGNPTSLAGFFHRGSDENLIVLSLAGKGDHPLEVIFHEYSHLLLRRNEQFWPLWLTEGMAEIYGAFEVASPQTVRIGKPPPTHLKLLSAEALPSLPELFAVTQDSPGYNEREHQGMFYAASWLLTHYLMLGDNPRHRASLSEFTSLLRKGQQADQAFTNAFHTSLPAMSAELRRYLGRGRFDELTLNVRGNLGGAQPMTTRRLVQAETCFRLGDELLRIGRFEEAESYFLESQKLAPASPLGYEGLGFLAAQREDGAKALGLLEEALNRGATNFLAYYVCAREQLRLHAKTGESYGRLDPVDAREIRSRLEKALAQMPDFGPAHHLLGFLELLQGENLGAAQQQLLAAIQLEPERHNYLLTLAQAQLQANDPAAARRTLEPLSLPYVDAQIRERAKEILERSARGRRQPAGP